MTQERRQFFRLRYPIDERPIIELDGESYPVCEISEEGARLLFRSTDPVSFGETLTGTIHFSDSEDVEVEGIPLRQHGCEVALKLTKGLSLERMTDEQLHLLDKYPGSFSSTLSQAYKLND
jgi:hypothetical protein